MALFHRMVPARLATTLLAILVFHWEKVVPVLATWYIFSYHLHHGSKQAELT